MDKHLDRAQAFAAGFAGCEASDAVEPEAFRRMLTECSPDLVHILLPHHLHCTYAVAALECALEGDRRLFVVAQRDAGKAVLLVSLELDEVMDVPDRILVMYEGEIVGELDPKTTTQEELGLYMAGAKRDEVKA